MWPMSPIDKNDNNNDNDILNWNFQNQIDSLYLDAWKWMQL